MRLLIAVLLAVALTVSLGSTIFGPNFNMFSVPDLSLKNLGFNQIGPSGVGGSPIVLAPTGQQLLHAGDIGTHVRPKLMTGNWTSSMKGSEVNQMFALLSRGIGNPYAPSPGR